MDKLLYISTQSVSEKGMSAGSATAWRNLYQLSKKHDIYIVLIINEKDKVNFEEYYSIGINSIKIFRINYLRKIFNILINIIFYSPKFAAKYQKNIFYYISNLIEIEKIPHLWCEFTEAGVYIPNDKMSNISIYAADVVTQWSLRCRGWISFFTNLTFQNEAKILEKASTVYFQSNKDIDLAKALFGEKNYVLSTPMIKNYREYVNNRDKSLIEYGSLLFWGAMNRIENETAIYNFVKNNWSYLEENIENLKLYIVGANPTDRIKSLQCRNIIVTGYIDDPKIYFQRCHIGIAPIESGAGIKVKVLEMLNVDMLVITTKIGAEGIPKQDNLFIEDVDNIGNKILEIINAV